ncbi:hypothetical protein FRC08_006066, partial [Ceratobasidium sp. 394]
MATTDKNVEIDTKEVPQHTDFMTDGGNFKMAAPVDQTERRLLRKLDCLIMPITWILYLLA